MSDGKTMTTPELEDAFDLIAEGADAAGESHERLYFAKLALTLAQRLGDVEQVREAVDIALADLHRPNAGIG